MPIILLLPLLAACDGSSVPAGPTISTGTRPSQAPPPSVPLDPPAADVATALEAPTHRGTLRLQVDSEGVQDTCAGTATLQHRDGVWLGLAECSFEGELSVFGGTRLTVRLTDRAGVPTGEVTTARGPLSQPVEGELTGDRLALPLGGAETFDDGKRMRWLGAIEVAPVE